MQKIVILLMMFSLTAVAGPHHKNHKRGGWVDELGLTETQAEQVKSIKQASHEKMMAYKEQLAVETEAELAKVLDDEQMAKLKEMRADRELHMSKKKHKKYKKKKQQAD